MKKQRYYLDTSVWGAVDDNEFRYDTAMFLRMVLKDGIICLYSQVVEDELVGAPEFVRKTFELLPNEQREKIALTPEIEKLADIYIEERVVGATSRNDCLHIAAATVHKADLLVSWNFKHIVNVSRAKGYNDINVRLGYPILKIRSPKEGLEYGYS